MKTWTLPAAALFCVLILLPGLGQGQAPSAILSAAPGGELAVTASDDGGLVVGPLSVSRDGVAVPVFDSISVSSFNYQSIESTRDSERLLGSSATMTRYDSSSPVVKVSTGVANGVAFDLASDAGALAGPRWVMAGEIGATADIFILGTGSFTTGGDTVQAALSPGDDLYLRVRAPGEPYEITSGVATGAVSGESRVAVMGDVAEASFVPYADVTISPVRAGRNGGTFAVSGSDGAKVVALTLDGVDAGARVVVDGRRVAVVNSPSALGGSEPVCWLSENGETVSALVYLPHMSLHTIEITSAALPEEAFTIASALAAAGGAVLVATATVWLFRK